MQLLNTLMHIHVAVSLDYHDAAYQVVIESCRGTYQVIIESCRGMLSCLYHPDFSTN